MTPTKMNVPCLALAILVNTMSVMLIEAQCSIPLFTASRSMIKDQTEFPEGMKIEITCFTGYALAPPAEGIKYDTICTNKVWKPQYNCIPVLCKGLPKVDNARIISLSKVPPVDDSYPYATEVIVSCKQPRTTENGRMRYRSLCNITSKWSDTSPCSVVKEISSKEYLVYSTSGIVSGFPYKDAYADTSSADYKAIVAAVQRALIVPMTNQFGPLYIEAKDLTFEKVDGSRTRVNFNAVFSTALQATASSVNAKIAEAFKAQGYAITDPSTKQKFQFEAGELSVAENSSFYISKGATIGLAVGGAMVGAMAIALLVACIGLQRNRAPRFAKAPNPYQSRPNFPEYSHYAPPRPNGY